MMSMAGIVTYIHFLMSVSYSIMFNPLDQPLKEQPCIVLFHTVEYLT